MKSRQNENEMKPAESQGIPGRILLPRLAIGCLLFAGIMGVGTYMIAQWTTPYFLKKAAEHLKEQGYPEPQRGY